jgi:hypothetical protein
MDQIQIILNNKVIRTIEGKIGDFSIGRGAENDIVLEDTKVSRHHARLNYDGLQYQITDLHSTNGTFLDEIQLLAGVPEKWLVNKLVRIGPFFLRLVTEVEIQQTSGETGISITSITDSKLSSTISGRVGIFLPEPKLSVETGSSVSTKVTLLNEGSLVDHFRVVVEGIPEEWVSIPTQEVQLMPGGQGEIGLEINPPRNPQSLAKIYLLKIKILSQVSQDEFVEGQIELEILPYYKFTANLRPQKYRGLKSGIFTIEISNLGNAETTFKLDASDPEDICNFEFDPIPATIQAGSEGQISLRIDSKIPFSGDTPKNHPFVIKAYQEGAPEITQEMHGEWERAYPTLEMRLQPPRKRSVDSGTFQVLLHNLSHEELNVQLEASDLEESCNFNFDMPQPIIPAMQERSVRMMVNPDTGLTTQEAITHTFRVTANFISAPSMQQQVQGEWVQLPPNFDISLSPNRLKSKSQAVYRLNIRNLTKSELTFRFRARDEENSCLYQFNPPELHVPGGQERICQLTIRPKYRLTGEETKIHQFNILAEPVVAPVLTKEVKGEWEQMPGMIIGGTGILRYLIAGLIMIFGWGFAFRPFIFIPEEIFCWDCYNDIAFQMGVHYLYEIDFFWSLVNAILTGLIGGIVTSLSLKICEFSLKLRNIFSITIGWLIASVVAYLFSIFITFLDLFTINLFPGMMIGNILFSFIGGLFIARALQKTDLPISCGSNLIIILVWMLAWATVFLAWDYTIIQNRFSAGILFGLIGGSITILIIYILHSKKE